MTQFYYLTDEIKIDEALVYTDNWRDMYYELKKLRGDLMNKLITLATASLSLHDAQLDPLIIKGICLALDHTYKIEDIVHIREHCVALDNILVCRNINTQLRVSCVPGAEDDEKKSLQVQILSNLLPIAQQAYIAFLLGKRSYHVNFFFYQALTFISSDPTIEQLEALVCKSRAATLLCTELLENAFSNS